MLYDWLILTWHLPTFKRAVKPLSEQPIKTAISPRSSALGTFRQKTFSWRNVPKRREARRNGCFRRLLSVELVKRHVTTRRHTEITKIWGFIAGVLYLLSRNHGVWLAILLTFFSVRCGQTSMIFTLIFNFIRNVTFNKSLISQCIIRLEINVVIASGFFAFE